MQVMRTRKLSCGILSVVLALTMVFSVLGGTVFAATPENVKHYRVVTSLGDSIATGFSLPDYKKKAGDRFSIAKVRIEGSYPAIVADTVKAETFYPLATPGFRSNELRFVLCNDYDGDWITHKWEPFLSYIETNDYEGLKAQRSEFQSKVAQSDLVLLDIGFNDTWHPAVAVLQEVIRNGEPSYDFDKESEEGAKMIVEGYSYDDLRHDLEVVLKAPYNARRLPEVLYKLLTLSDYLPNYEAIVKRIYELNPNATIVAVGTYNPFRDWPEEWAQPLKQAAQTALYDRMNQQKKDFAKKYGDQFIYVDISDIPPVIQHSWADVTAAGGFSAWDPHPTVAGHQYEAQQIISCLPEDCGCKA